MNFLQLTDEQIADVIVANIAEFGPYQASPEDIFSRDITIRRFPHGFAIVENPELMNVGIWFLFVDPLHRGKGFGSKYLRAIVREFVGFSNILLVCQSALVEFYSRHGFRVVSKGREHISMQRDRQRATKSQKAQREAAALAKRKKETAHHEAGHAVMAWLWWKENHLVNIDMRGKFGIHASVNSERRCDITTLGIGPRELMKMNATALVMEFFAGPVAGSRFNDSGADWFSQAFEEYFDLGQSQTSDMGQAIAAAQVVYGSTGKRWFGFISTVARWTEDAIFHPKVWPMVEALGARLETQQTMRASTAIRVMEQAAGDGWNHPVRLHALGRTWKRRIVLPAFETE